MNPKSGQKKAVIFDNGHVLARENWQTLAELLKMGLPIAYNDRVLLRTFMVDARGPAGEKLYEQYSRGEIASDSFWSAVLEQGFRIAATPHHLDMIKHVYGFHLQEPNERVLPLLARLKHAGNKVLILSNTLPDLESVLQSGRYPQFEIADKCYFSHRIGHRKPEPGAYQYVLQDQGLAAREAVFVDNKQVNLDAAEALGITPVRFEFGENPYQLVAGLAAAGVRFL